jgi:hypothetical protein
MILYVGGKPYMRYRGPHDPREIGRFIMEVSQKIQSNQSFAKTDQRIKQNPRNGIPEYTIGHPLFGPDDKVCYITFDDYGKEHIGPQHTRPRQMLPSQSGMSTGRDNYDPSGMGGVSPEVARQQMQQQFMHQQRSR